MNILTIFEGDHFTDIAVFRIDVSNGRFQWLGRLLPFLVGGVSGSAASLSTPDREGTGRDRREG